MTAAGVVVGTSITSITLSKFGDKLPLLMNKDGTRSAPATIAYAILIPGLAGILFRKYNRGVSDGLIIGGLAAGALAAIQVYAPSTTKAALGFGNAVGYQPVRALGAAPASFGGMNRGNGLGVLASASPFPSSNWGK
jgi:hypothetical protein